MTIFSSVLKSKVGKWRKFSVPDMICDDLKKIVGDAYELEDSLPYTRIIINSIIHIV